MLVACLSICPFRPPHSTRPYHYFQMEHVRAREDLVNRLDRERSTAEKRAVLAASRAGEASLAVEEKAQEIGALEADNR